MYPLTRQALRASVLLGVFFAVPSAVAFGALTSHADKTGLRPTTLSFAEAGVPTDSGVAMSGGAGSAHLVDFAREIEDGWLDGVLTVGVTSGASVPEVLVRDVLEWLAERGWASVEEINTAEESVTFSLPRELRPPRSPSAS